jgi:hypothetical protein
VSDSGQDEALVINERTHCPASAEATQ